MMEKNISLKNILNDTSFPKGGELLFQYAKDAIDKGWTVSIDMTDVESFPTVFMNTSFGELIDHFGIDKTKEYLRFKNVTKAQIERIRKYFNDYDNLLIEKKLILYIPNRGGAFLDAGEVPPLQKTLYDIDDNSYIEPNAGFYLVKSKSNNDKLSEPYTSLRDLISWYETIYNIKLMPDTTK